MKICVIGLGKIGLPLAVQAAGRGHEVIGADIDNSVVESVNDARAPFPNEAELDSLLSACVGNRALVATTDTEAAVAKSEVVVVVVPLVVKMDGEPQYEAIDAATAAIGRGLQFGTLVCYETTVPVGTTRRRFAPALEAESGLAAGKDFHVCFSPERVSSGHVFADLRRYPKLVGGLDGASTDRAVAFYEAILNFDDRPDLQRQNGVWALSSSEAAEFAKLAETTYRDVNIALANEYARYADSIGLDVYEAIDAANSQPYSHVHRPGIAVGGHCIPVYHRFYLSGDAAARLPAVARVINESMPEYAVRLVENLLGTLDGATVAVLGVAYRPGVKETAFSGAHDVVRELVARGATAMVHDPLFSSHEIESMGYTPFTLGSPCDAAVIQTDHREYASLRARDLPGVRVVLDGRRTINPEQWPGVAVKALGAP